MQIKNLGIKNYRSIQELKFENLGKMNILIGKNNAGKSNILRALEMILNRIKAGQLLFYVYEGNENFIKLYDENFMKLNEYDFYRRNKNENIYIYLDIEIKKDKEDKEDNLIANLEAILKKKIGKINQTIRLELILSKYKNSSCGRINIKLKKNDVWEDVFEVKEDKIRHYLEQKKLFSQLENEINHLEYIQRIFVDENNRGYTNGRYTRTNDAKMLITTDNDVDSRNDPKFIRVIDEINRYIDRQINNEKDNSFSKNIKMLINESKNLENLEEIIEKYLFKKNGEKRAIKNEIPFLIDDESQELMLLKNLSDILRFSKYYIDEERFKEVNEEISRWKNDVDEDEKYKKIKIFFKESFGVNLDTYSSTFIDKIPLYFNGDGYNKTTKFILQNEINNNNILIIEEPEVNLHPSLEKMLGDYLNDKSNTQQIFVSTHSTNFIDFYNYANIYLVKKGKNESTKIVNTDGNEELKKLIISELGIDFRTILTSEMLVFVEGKSDKYIFERLFGKKKKNINVKIIPINGCSNIKHLLVEKVLDFLKDLNIKFVFIIDRDDKSEKELEKFKEIFENNSIEKEKLKILERREIENYFLVSELIQKYIFMKREKEVPLEKIKKDLEIVINDLKNETIIRKLTREVFFDDKSSIRAPIYFDNLDYKDSSLDSEKIIGVFNNKCDEIKKNIDFRIEALNRDCEKKLVELKNEWEKDKYKIVKGSDVLKNVLNHQKMELTYKKGEISGEFVEKITYDELDEDLKKMINEILD